MSINNKNDDRKSGMSYTFERNRKMAVTYNFLDIRKIIKIHIFSQNSQFMSLKRRKRNAEVEDTNSVTIISSVIKFVRSHTNFVLKFLLFT